MIGYLTCDCHIYDAHSLKEKRSVLKRLINIIRKQYNVSIAEMNYQDLWQRTVLGIALVANDRVVVERELQKVLKTIDTFAEIECTNYTIDWL